MNMVKSIKEKIGLQGVTSIRIDTNHLILIGLYVMGLLIVAMSPYLLPKKYFFDNDTLISLIQNTNTSTLPKSFANTAFLYKLMGFGTFIPVSVGKYIIYTLSFIVVLLPNKNFVNTIRFFSAEHLIVIAWLMVLSIYLGQYSKELFSLILVFLLFKSFSNNYAFAFTVGLIMMYASYVRIYWFIVLILFLFGYFLSIIKIDKYLKILSLLLFITTFYFIVHIVTGKFITDARYSINITRIHSDYANTMIHNLFINTSTFTDIINTVYCWFILLIPINMIFQGFIQGLFALLQVTTVLFIIYKSLKNYRFIKMGYEVVVKDSYRQMLTVAVWWIFSFSFVEAMFEPDYGTFSRHELAILPMMIFILFYLSSVKFEELK